MDIENGIDKPTENWTRFPNSILDNLDQFEPNEFKVLAFVIRKNLGWRDRANRRFAVRYVSARLNMADRTAWAAIQGLEKKGLIHCIDRERSGLKLYEVTWKIPVKSRRVRGVAKNATGQRVAKNTTLPLQKMQTVLETKVIETSKDLSVLPTTFERQRTTNRGKADIPEQLEIKVKPIYDLLISLGQKKAIVNAYKTKAMSLRISKAIDKHGIEEVKQAITGRCISHKDDIKLSWLFDGNNDFSSALIVYDKRQKTNESGWHSPQTAPMNDTQLADLEETLKAL